MDALLGGTLALALEVGLPRLGSNNVDWSHSAKSACTSLAQKQFVAFGGVIIDVIPKAARTYQSNIAFESNSLANHVTEVMRYSFTNSYSSTPCLESSPLPLFLASLASLTCLWRIREIIPRGCSMHTPGLTITIGLHSLASSVRPSVAVCVRESEHPCLDSAAASRRSFFQSLATAGCTAWPTWIPRWCCHVALACVATIPFSTPIHDVPHSCCCRVCVPNFYTSLRKDRYI